MKKRQSTEPADTGPLAPADGAGRPQLGEGSALPITQVRAPIQYRFPTLPGAAPQNLHPPGQLPHTDENPGGEPGRPFVDREREEGLQADDIRIALKAKIDELPEGELTRLWNELINPLPDQAPHLWTQRTSGREVSPAKFIEDTYAHWRDQITLAYIGRIDPELYGAYTTWLRRHPDGDLKLPTEARRPQKQVDIASNGAAPRKSLASVYVPISQLPPDEAERRRAYNTKKKKEYRTPK